MPMLLHEPTRERQIASNDRPSKPGSLALTCGAGQHTTRRGSALGAARARALVGPLGEGCLGDLVDVLHVQLAHCLEAWVIGTLFQ